MAPERSRPLHNFSLPPPKWGSQKFHGFKKNTPNSETSMLDYQSMSTESKSNQFRATPQIQIQNSKPKFNRTTHNDCIVGETKTDAIQETDPINPSLANKIKVSTREEVRENKSTAGITCLRTRRAYCKAPQEVKKNEERAKFSIYLSKEEVEEDFIALFGRKPRKRPKKRPKILQKKLNSIFPGSRLREVSLHSYNVSDFPKSFKGRRQLRI